MSDDSPYKTPESDLNVVTGSSVLTLKEILFSFEGRVPRKVFWLYGVLGYIAYALLVMLIIGGLTLILGEGEWIVALIIPAYIPLLWALLAINIKRWHDRDKSAWWILIGFIPLIGPLWQIIECGFLEGTRDDNRYGPQPGNY